MTIFSKILAGEIPCYKIAESEKFLAILDVYPSTAGHTLVIPKVEIDRLFDLPDEYLDGLLTFAKPVANAIRKVFDVNRVNILTIGFEVPHAHVHLIPMNRMADADISIKKNMTSDELKAVQEKILMAMQS